MMGLFIYDLTLTHDDGTQEPLDPVEFDAFPYDADHSRQALAVAAERYPTIGRYLKIGERRVPIAEIEGFAATLRYCEALPPEPFDEPSTPDEHA